VALQLLVNQVLLADLEELFQGHAPVIKLSGGDPGPRPIASYTDWLPSSSINAVHVILLGIELVQRGKPARYPVHLYRECCAQPRKC